MSSDNQPLNDPEALSNEIDLIHYIRSLPSLKVFDAVLDRIERRLLQEQRAMEVIYRTN